MRYWLVLAFLFSLSGCYINEKGYICSLTMPRAYCDWDAYQALIHPTPLIEYWVRSETSKELRLKDWMVCGGSSDGYYGVAALPNGLIRTGEQSREESRLLYYEIDRCMMRKNYQYIGQCENSVTEKFPACRARRGESWE